MPQINQAIVEGIRNAVARGESLKQAMMSFYNAGYDRTEIENAAREFQKQQAQGAIQMPPQTQIQKPKQPSITSPPELKTKINQQATKVSSYGQQKKQPEKKKNIFSRFFSKKSKQKLTPTPDPARNQGRQADSQSHSPKNQVSNYETQKPTKSKGIFSSKWFVITLIIIFIILVGILISLFIFKNQLVAFFNPPY